VGLGGAVISANLSAGVRRGTGSAIAGKAAAAGGRGERFLDWISGAFPLGGLSGAASSTNVGGAGSVFAGDATAIASSAIWIAGEGNAVGSAGVAAGALGGGTAATLSGSLGAASLAGGSAGAGSSVNLVGGTSSRGRAFADSTSGRTRESIVSPAGTAGSSSVKTEVSVAADECPLVSPKSRYCCGAAASSGTGGTARSFSTMDKTPLVTAIPD
jgi:hypothetical protein